MWPGRGQISLEAGLRLFGATWVISGGSSGALESEMFCWLKSKVSEHLEEVSGDLEAEFGDCSDTKTSLRLFGSSWEGPVCECLVAQKKGLYGLHGRRAFRGLETGS